MSVSVEGFTPSTQSVSDQIGVSAHTLSMVLYSDNFVGKYLYKSASEILAAFAKSREVVRSKPFFAKTPLAASMIAFLRSSEDRRDEPLM
jgi:hypothetical protein